MRQSDHRDSEGRKGLRGRLHDRLRAAHLRDDSGISTESIIIGILLLAILATAVAFAIQWALNLGQTTVARSNLEIAATAAASQQAASLDGVFTPNTIDSIRRAVPEITFAPASTTQFGETQSGSCAGRTVGGTAITGVNTSAWCTASSVQTGDAPNTGAVVTGTWTAGRIAPTSIAFHISGGAIDDTDAAPGEESAAGQILWLLARAENDDTYCAVIVGRVSNQDTTNSNVGTWFDAEPSTAASPATCGMGGAGTPWDGVASANPWTWRPGSRTIPDIN